MSMEEKLLVLLGPDWMTEIKRGSMSSKNMDPEQENEGEQEIPHTQE